MCNSIVSAVLDNGLNNTDKLAVADVNQMLTYGELTDAIKKVASYMTEIGISYDDKLLVECTQDIRFIVLDLACQYIGAVFVPFEKDAVLSRVSDIYVETAATFIIGCDSYSEVGRWYDIDTVWSEAFSKSDASVVQKENEVAEILFSTGTTGKPKGIVISNKANVAIAQNIADGVKMSQDTIELIPLPLSHSHGLRTCYANLLNCSGVVLIDGVKNIKLFFDVIEKYSVNAIDISPTIAALLLKIAKRGLKKIADSIDYVEIGTAALNDTVKEGLKAIFTQTRLYNFYGATEAGRSCVLEFGEYDDTGCIGKPSVNASIQIVDDNRNVINSCKDNVGSIIVSGDMMMEGYLNDPELTRSTLDNGILYTNDIGYINENGYVYVIGRQGDVINYKGIKIAPEEIEAVVLKCRGIRDCACVPEKDEICGQLPKLFIEVDEGASIDVNTLREYIRTQLEESRVPKNIVIIDKIPRSLNGKILRRELRNE